MFGFENGFCSSPIGVGNLGGSRSSECFVNSLSACLSVVVESCSAVMIMAVEVASRALVRKPVSMTIFECESYPAVAGDRSLTT